MAALDKYRLADEEVPERRPPDIAMPVPAPVPRRPRRSAGSPGPGFAPASGLASVAGLFSLRNWRERIGLPR